jgi:hypothetical protein
MPWKSRLPAPDRVGEYRMQAARQTGLVNFRGEIYRLPGVLAQEQVALEEVDDGVWSVFFFNTLLGRLDERTLRIAHTATATGRRLGR